MTGRQLILQRVSPVLSTRVVSGTVSHLTHNRSFGTSVSRQSTALEPVSYTHLTLPTNREV